MGNRSVLRSTATLACIGRRQDYFRDEFIATVQIPLQGRRAGGSSEGLVGRGFRPHPIHAHQLPALCRDFDGDGKRNVVDSIPDVIASTATNLMLDGWEFGKTWGYEVFCRPASIFACGPHQALHHRPMGLAWCAPARRRRFPAPERHRLPAAAHRRKGPAFLVLAELQRHPEVQPRDAMPWPSAIWRIGCAAAIRSWPPGRRTSGRSRARSGSRS